MVTVVNNYNSMVYASVKDGLLLGSSAVRGDAVSVPKNSVIGLLAGASSPTFTPSSNVIPQFDWEAVNGYKMYKILGDITIAISHNN